MNEPLISILVDVRNRIYQPGDLLRGEHQIDAVEPADIRALEISVVWYTEGKGDEDMTVHYFQRLSAEEDGNHMNLHQLRNFSTLLPKSPLSYDGEILKIRWCSRLRLFMAHGKQYVVDVPFQLGNMPSTPHRKKHVPDDSSNGQPSGE